MRSALEGLKARLSVTEERLNARLSLSQDRLDFQEKLLSERSATERPTPALAGLLTGRTGDARRRSLRDGGGPAVTA